MGRIAGRPTPLPWVAMVLLASVATGGPPDEPKSKAPSGKKAAASKPKGPAGSKADDSKPKPKTDDEKQAEEKAKRKDAALKAAEAYLILLDKGKYGESWEAMTAEVKRGITRRKWVDTLGKTKGTYGPLQGRKLRKVDMRATDVADRFDEAWVHAEFQAVDGQAASELIIVVLQDGKDWVVNSYWIGDPANFPKPPAEEKEGPKAVAK